ncbi:hypothetical protein AN958_00554, partial [Leucoagaricus sp. SymC.cos]
WLLECKNGGWTLKNVAKGLYVAMDEHPNNHNEYREGIKIVGKQSPHTWHISHANTKNKQHFRIYTPNDGKCLDLSCHGAGPGVDLWGQWEGTNQLWTFEEEDIFPGTKLLAATPSHVPIFAPPRSSQPPSSTPKTEYRAWVAIWVGGERKNQLADIIQYTYLATFLLLRETPRCEVGQSARVLRDDWEDDDGWFKIILTVTDDQYRCLVNNGPIVANHFIVIFTPYPDVACTPIHSSDFEANQDWIGNKILRPFAAVAGGRPFTWKEGHIHALESALAETRSNFSLESPANNSFGEFISKYHDAFSQRVKELSDFSEA